MEVCLFKWPKIWVLHVFAVLYFLSYLKKNVMKLATSCVTGPQIQEILVPLEKPANTLSIITSTGELWIS